MEKQVVRNSIESSLNGFSKLTVSDRLQKLESFGIIRREDVIYLKSGCIKDTALGENFIENVIGYFQIPLGIATNFKIDGRDVLIPMAVEETSIIAAASKTAKWVRENGKITTEVIGNEIIGQIQFPKVTDFDAFEKKIKLSENEFVDLSNREVAFGMLKRGGGVKRISVRKLLRPDGFFMGVVHVYMDALDAMGANVMNQVCEFLKLPLEEITGEKVGMCILSNLVDSKITRASVEIRNIDSDLANKIQEASLFAEIDPYRAATNNKGILNGIDPILIATGNDWRAVESGCHAYAARSGSYSSLTKWRFDKGILTGIFEAPVIVGMVGGVTTLHPTAKIAMGILDVKSAAELSRLCAAVGLVQNLGALRALTTVGIIEGHMKLHIKNLSLGAGASEREIPFVARKLEEILRLKKRISLSNAIDVLSELRSLDGIKKMRNEKLGDRSGEAFVGLEG